MLIPNQMAYDESHHKQSFQKMDSTLFIKLMCGYTSSILCKIFFVIICLTPTWNASCKKTARDYFLNLVVTKNFFIYASSVIFQQGVDMVQITLEKVLGKTFVFCPNVTGCEIIEFLLSKYVSFCGKYFTETSTHTIN